jgi:hypothetical protein
MDQAYKYMTSTCIALNYTKDIMENIPKTKKYNLEERKSHHQTSMREKNGIGSFSTREEKRH